MSNEFKTGVVVKTKDGKLIGETTGSTHRCTLEGCTGLRVAVRWKDGSRTFPCTRGMEYSDRAGWRIL